MGRSQKQNSEESIETNAYRKFKDRLVALVHLSVRAFYNSVGWFVLGMDVTSTFFVSLCLYVVPILMDSYYYSFSRWSKVNIVTKEIAVCLVWTFIAVLGAFGIFAVKDNMIVVASNFVAFQDISIPVKWLWWALGTIPVITWIDFGCRYSMKTSKGKEE